MDDQAGKPQSAVTWANEVGSRRKYSLATRNTLLALAQFIEVERNPCPSFKDMADKTGHSLASTQKAIQQMERDGEIIRQIGVGHTVKGGATCHYMLVGYHSNLPIPERRPAPARQYPTGEYVYLLRTELGHFKIGCAKDPAKRMQGFASTLPISAEYVCVIRCENRLVTERELHQRFASKRKQGEWFDLSPEDIECIKAMAVQA